VLRCDLGSHLHCRTAPHRAASGASDAGLLQCCSPQRVSCCAPAAGSGSRLRPACTVAQPECTRAHRAWATAGTRTLAPLRLKTIGPGRRWRLDAFRVGHPSRLEAATCNGRGWTSRSRAAATSVLSLQRVALHTIRRRGAIFQVAQGCDHRLRRVRPLDVDATGDLRVHCLGERPQRQGAAESPTKGLPGCWLTSRLKRTRARVPVEGCWLTPIGQEPSSKSSRSAHPSCECAHHLTSAA
jgi:hypothetical protein